MDKQKDDHSKEKRTMQYHAHPSKARAVTIRRTDDEHDQKHSSAKEQVELAAIALGFNVRLRSSDMPVRMQEHALRCTRSFVDSSPKQRPNNTHLARALKKEFDSVYGPAWHCVVGTSFGSFVTHSPGGFVYFSLDSLSVLLFQTVVQLVAQPALPTKAARYFKE